MTTTKEQDTKQESLSSIIKTVTKSWDEIKSNAEVFRNEIEQLYFRTNPSRMELFLPAKFKDQLTQEDMAKKLHKHSNVIINCMEILVEFLNGNEETKPIFYVMGKHHKLLNVNEKMFIEMKDAICKVIRRRLDMESSKAWDTILQFVFINYIFSGMHKYSYTFLIRELWHICCIKSGITIKNSSYLLTLQLMMISIST